MLDKKSIVLLAGVHADLVDVVKRAHEIATTRKLEFRITEGLRTLARQKQLVASGASRTMASRHLTGHAVDFVPIVAGEVCWKWPAFWPIVECFEVAGTETGVEIECGARWVKFPDGPHVQLSKEVYP